MATPSLHKRCRRCQQLVTLDQLKRELQKRQGRKDEWTYKHLCLKCHAEQEALRRAAVDRPLCACGCGEQVKYPGSQYRFGHRVPTGPKGHNLRVEPPSWKVQSLTDGSDKPKKYERADKRKFKTCSKCGEIKERSEFDTYSTTDYYGKIITRICTYCKPCTRAKTQDYRKSLTGEAKTEYLRRAKERSLLRKYGITLADFEELKRSQDDACAICKQWRCLPAVDHCHKSGRVRGLLCRKCNSALGLLGEDETIVSNLLEYIRNIVNKP